MSGVAEFDPDKFFAEGGDPESWLKMGIALKHAAERLDWTKKIDITDWRFVPIYRMLMALSVENLLKGIQIAEGHEAIEKGQLSKRLGSHGLRRYADGVSGVEITEHEKKILDELQSYLMWAGRYPMPKRVEDTIRIGHSKRGHDAELALGQKLADYLVD